MARKAAEMKCPCGFPTIVKDGRYIPEGYWRRRQCPSCGAVITTVEQVCQTVKGKSGHRPKAPVITTPRPPKVTVSKRRNAEQKPTASKQKAPMPKPTWMLIEEMKEQRELDKLNEEAKE